jgi:hypothetical protein
MSQVLTIKKSGLGNFGKNSRQLKNSTSSGCRIFSLNKAKSHRSQRIDSFEQAGSGLKVAGTTLIMIIIFSGIFYLYQVNDLTNKGYEMENIITHIERLSAENEKNKIREVELRSMYNIEKVTENLNLVKAEDISYLELDSPLAMK